MKKILVIGSNGQLGMELLAALRKKFGSKNVTSSDINDPSEADTYFEKLDARDAISLTSIVEKYEINHVYHLAAILSANGELNPISSWEVNMKTLLNVLELGRKGVLDQAMVAIICLLHEDSIHSYRYKVFSRQDMFEVDMKCLHRFLCLYLTTASTALTPTPVLSFKRQL